MWTEIKCNDKKGIEKFLSIWDKCGCSAHRENHKELRSSTYNNLLSKNVRMFIYDNKETKMVFIMIDEGEYYEVAKATIYWDINNKNINLDEVVRTFVLFQKQFAKKKPILVRAGNEEDFNPEVRISMISKWWGSRFIRICNEEGVDVSIDEKGHWTFTVRL